MAFDVSNIYQYFLEGKSIMKIFILFLLSTWASAEPTLIGGRPALNGEFPEAVYINFGGSRCSGSIIGERVLLSAAHCANDNSIGYFQIDQQQYSARCNRHPLYPRTDIDLLLCRTNRKVHVRPTTIGDYVYRGDVITIVGYGCTRPGGGGGNDGVLRFGDATVIGFQGYDIVSRGAGLCFGDSGGPVFKKLSNPFTEKHIQIAVNSKGNIRDTNYTTAIHTAKNWIIQWASDNGVDICGITKNCDEPKKCLQEKLLLDEAKKAYERCIKT